MRKMHFGQYQASSAHSSTGYICTYTLYGNSTCTSTAHLAVRVPRDAGSVGLLVEQLLGGEVIDHQHTVLVHNRQLGTAGGEGGGRREGRGRGMGGRGREGEGGGGREGEGGGGRREREGEGEWERD